MSATAEPNRGGLCLALLSVDRPQTTTTDWPAGGVLNLEFLMRREKVDLVRLVVPAGACPRRAFADSVRDDLTSHGMQVISAPASAYKVKVVVVVAKPQPADSRTTPPFLVAEPDLVAERAALTWDDQVDHQLTGRPVCAEILEVDAAKPVESRVEIVPALVVSLR